MRRSVLCLILLILPTTTFAQRDRYALQRNYMVDEYVAKEGVTNKRVLTAMRTVPRHEFMLANTRRQAYHDVALPIGHKQTISPPFIVAYMTEIIDPQQTEKVLEIGTGSGYQAAVLGELADEVYSIEIVPELGRSAAARLKRLGYENVTTKVGDGYQGWEEHAPFDKIIVTCSPENVPTPLIEQLKEGGKMIIPLGERYQQVFYLFEKQGDELVKKKLMPTLFVPMTGISEEKRQIQPDPTNPSIVNGNFETVSNEQPDGFHYRRQTTLKNEDPPEGRYYLELQNSERGRNAHILQGLPLDGRSVPEIEVRFSLKLEDLEPLRSKYQQPAFVVHFYDAIRRPLGEGMVGPFLVDTKWHRVSGRIRVPPKTREAIIRVGLNGSVGTMSVDNMTLQRVK